MPGITTSRTILVAEDDPEDRLFMTEAFEEAWFEVDLRFVEHGEELLDYLLRRGKYGDKQTSPKPELILLDLNMPRIDGREALRDIKQNPHLRAIPVVVLTTSSSGRDIIAAYSDGVNSFITKPANFEQLVDAIKSMKSYWFNLVTLPTTV